MSDKPSSLQIDRRSESSPSSSSSSASSRNEPSEWDEILENVKLFLASCVVYTLILVVIIGVSNTYCILQIHPVANFLLLLMALTLLAYVEALHYGVVAIEKWDMSKYEAEYPRVREVHKLVDTPVKVKKFLVGRQFSGIFVGTML
mgnify:FL=1